MPRSKPRIEWEESQAVVRELTEKQRKRLTKCGLPAYVLPAVEGIARRAISQACDTHPRPAESHAALKVLHRKTKEARKALQQTDAWTKKYLNLAHAKRPQPRPGRFKLLTVATDEMLADIEAAIAAANEMIGRVIVPPPTRLAMTVVRDLKLTFQMFNIPSPATETLSVVLNMVELTRPAAVDHYIRKALGE